MEIYKVEVTDLICPQMPKKGFLIVKHSKKNALQLIDGETYLADQVKIVVNKKGEIVIISNSITVFRAEQDDIFTVESFELSQKEEDQIDGGLPSHMHP